MSMKLNCLSFNMSTCEFEFFQYVSLSHSFQLIINLIWNPKFVNVSWINSRKKLRQQKNGYSEWMNVKMQNFRKKLNKIPRI
jgi:hypothetical protein